MGKDLSALKAAIKLIVDAGKDVAAKGSLASYANLLPEVMALLPQLGEIPAEAQGLVAADYLSLVEELVADLAVSDAHAQSVITAALKVLQDVVAMVPDVEALIAAIKAPAVAASGAQ